MRKLLLAAAFALATTPAFAQFPPPGVYACMDANGPVGTLTLLVAGDYDFQSTTHPSGQGQVASAGNTVNSISGPLADLHLTGTFSTDERGEASFIFDTDKGRWQCALPPA